MSPTVRGAASPAAREAATVSALSMWGGGEGGGGGLEPNTQEKLQWVSDYLLSFSPFLPDRWEKTEDGTIRPSNVQPNTPSNATATPGISSSLPNSATLIGDGGGGGIPSSSSITTPAGSISNSSSLPPASTSYTSPNVSKSLATPTPARTTTLTTTTTNTAVAPPGVTRSPSVSVSSSSSSFKHTFAHSTPRTAAQTISSSLMGLYRQSKEGVRSKDGKKGKGSSSGTSTRSSSAFEPRPRDTYFSSLSVPPAPSFSSSYSRPIRQTPFNLDPSVMSALCLLLSNRVFHNIHSSSRQGGKTKKNQQEKSKVSLKFSGGDGSDSGSSLPPSSSSSSPSPSSSSTSLSSSSSSSSSSSLSSSSGPVTVTKNEFVVRVQELTEELPYGDPLKALVSGSVPLIFVDEKGYRIRSAYDFAGRNERASTPTRSTPTPSSALSISGLSTSLPHANRVKFDLSGGASGGGRKESLHGEEEDPDTHSRFSFHPFVSPKSSGLASKARERELGKIQSAITQGGKKGEGEDAGRGEGEFGGGGGKRGDEEGKYESVPSTHDSASSLPLAMDVYSRLYLTPNIRREEMKELEKRYVSKLSFTPSLAAKSIKMMGNYDGKRIYELPQRKKGEEEEEKEEEVEVRGRSESKGRAITTGGGGGGETVGRGGSPQKVRGERSVEWDLKGGKKGGEKKKGGGGGGGDITSNKTNNSKIPSYSTISLKTTQVQPKSTSPIRSASFGGKEREEKGLGGGGQKAGRVSSPSKKNIPRVAINVDKIIRGYVSPGKSTPQKDEHPV